MNGMLPSKPLGPALLVAVALLASTIAAVAYTHRLQSLTASIVAENVASLLAAEELEFALRDIRNVLYQYALSGDEAWLADLPRLDAEFRDWLRKARASAVTAEERGYLDELVTGYDGLIGAAAGIAAGMNEAERRETARGLADELSRRLVPLCHAFLEHNERSIETNAAAHAGVALRLQTTLILAGLLVPLGGVLVGYLASRGVSLELARSREELLRAEQLAAVGRLAAGMAHELRNPLTSILMMVQTARPDEPADLVVIEDEVRRMERTIRTCLDFAKPPSPDRGRIDLREVVADACRLAEARLRRQRIELALEQFPAPLPCLADPHQLHQVLVNLLLNAIDAAGNGGRVRVATATDGRWVVVRVRDDGPGIAADVLPRLFEPFVSSKEAGTGLGLSISKRIVEGHGGRIEGRNRREGGAEFVVRLPALDASEAADARTADATDDGTERRPDADAAGDRRRAEHPARVPQGVPR